MAVATSAVHAIVLASVSGFATTIGSFSVLLFGEDAQGTTSGKMLALSAGVMIQVSAFSIMPEAAEVIGWSQSLVGVECLCVYCIYVCVRRTRFIR